MMEKFIDWIFDTRTGNAVGLLLFIPACVVFIAASVIAGRSILEVPAK